jgi:hypothetical protein
MTSENQPRYLAKERDGVNSRNEMNANGMIAKRNTPAMIFNHVVAMP